MKPIQIILIIALLVLAVLYMLFFKNKGTNRILFILNFMIGVVFVIIPNFTNAVANFLGVGRGADLLLYFSIVWAYFAFIFLYSKLRAIQATQTEIIRKMAIRDAKNLKSKNSSY